MGWGGLTPAFAAFVFRSRSLRWYRFNSPILVQHSAYDDKYIMIFVTVRVTLRHAV